MVERKTRGFRTKPKAVQANYTLHFAERNTQMKLNKKLLAVVLAGLMTMTVSGLTAEKAQASFDEDN